MSLVITLGALPHHSLTSTPQHYTRDGTDNASNPHHHIDLFIEKVLVFYKPIASDEVLDGSGIEARGTGSTFQE